MAHGAIPAQQQARRERGVRRLRRASMLASALPGLGALRGFTAGLTATDVATVTGIATGLPIVRLLLHVYLFQPLGRLALCPGQANGLALPVKLDNKLNKFCESCWKFSVYAVLFTLGVYALHDAPWLSNSAMFWEGFPDQAIPAKVRQYYGAEGAFYVSSVFALFLWEERRKDFHAMLVHHVATVALIAGSWSMRFVRVGSIVMLLHDPSDVFLEGAKLANYAGLEGVTTALFAALLLSWLGLRLVLLPLWVIRSTSFGVVDVLGYRPAYSRELSALLVLLVVLHAYWFWLMLRIACTMVLSGNAKDSREEED